MTFFFDMFENNLIKEEINNQREKAAQLQKQKIKKKGQKVALAPILNIQIRKKEKKIIKKIIKMEN